MKKVNNKKRRYRDSITNKEENGDEKGRKYDTESRTGPEQACMGRLNTIVSPTNSSRLQ